MRPREPLGVLYPELEPFYAGERPYGEVPSSSLTHVSWRCRKHPNHVFQRTPRHYAMRSQRECPICLGRQVLSGYNDLDSHCAENTALSPLLQEYGGENELTPEEIYYYSSRKVQWLCRSCHASWECSPRVRLERGQGCPYCSGVRARPGSNDLLATHGELVAKRWDYQLNTLSPSEVKAGSSKKIWWRCGNGLPHSFTMSPKMLLRRSISCPYCSGHRVLVGFNDLATVKPSCLVNWDTMENELPPEKFTAGSSKTMAARCSKCSHQWNPTVKSFTRDHSCPSCERHGSHLENIVYAHLVSVLPERPLRRQRLAMDPTGRKLEVDFLIPSLALGIEVQDFATHSRDRNDEPVELKHVKAQMKKGPLYHGEKGRAYREQCGVQVVELWEDEIRSGEFKGILAGHLRGKTSASPSPLSERSATTQKRLQAMDGMLNRSMNDVDVFTHRRSVELHCVCPRRHSFTSTIKRATQVQQLCPYCSGRKAGYGESIADSELVGEYSDRNYLLPREVPLRWSAEVYWWRCPGGHDYEMTLVNKMNGHRCGICHGSTLSATVNSLAALYPREQESFSPENGVGSHEVRPRAKGVFSWRCHLCGEDVSMTMKRRLSLGDSFCSCSW